MISSPSREHVRAYRKSSLSILDSYLTLHGQALAFGALGGCQQDGEASGQAAGEPGEAFPACVNY